MMTAPQPIEHPPFFLEEDTSVSFSSSPSSFSASSSSSSPSIAVVVHEQPSLPPGPIKKTMQAASVVANLIAFDLKKDHLS
mmetsp:Transcript_3517/g.8094  ORF Transcript_3517/g.8094 Transcript_3517/m.8094 type:complete len:81 (+) Transcript_3517:1499-1741(+)